MPTSQSRQLFDRARAVIPGGVNSPVRAFGSVGGTPRFVVHGHGVELVDEDGNRYIDLVQSWGPLPFGHARSEIINAARGAVQRGSTFGAPTRAEITLAELIVHSVPSVEQVRLVNSGTEAAMSALRLARGATGRDKVLKFRGHYHGHVDSLLVEAGSGVATLGIPGSPGVTAGSAGDTVLVDWNDPDGVREAVTEYGDDLAAIVCEPVAANMNLVPPVEGFLQLLREQADACGAVLIFDEVITGFRLARGGAQQLFGVEPDLTVLGKIIGGGFPLAAFGGSQELMSHLAPDGPVYQAGTLSGNPVAVAAGIAQIQLLTDNVYTWLEKAAKLLANGLTTAFDEAGVTATVTRHGTLLGVVFSHDAPRNYADVKAADHEAYARFFHLMLERGVYLAPSGYEVLFTCTALDQESIGRVLGAAEASATAMAGV